MILYNERFLLIFMIKSIVYKVTWSWYMVRKRLSQLQFSVNKDSDIGFFQATTNEARSAQG